MQKIAIAILAAAAFTAGCNDAVAPSSAGPSAGPSAAPSSSPAAPAWSGTVFGFQVVKDQSIDMYAVTGATRTKVASAPGGPDSCTSNSVTVSPDGKRIAWVDGTIRSLEGDLYVATIGGGAAKKLAERVLCGGRGPQWGPDSRTMWFGTRDDQQRSVDVESGAITPRGALPLTVWSPGGAVQAYTNDAHNKIFVAKANGEVIRAVAYKPTWAECEGWMTQSLSEDGRYLAVGYAACDPSRMLSVEKVIDTTTGQEIALPLPKVERVYFRADGSMIAITGSYGYVIVDGEIVAKQQLATDRLTIVRYAA